MDVDYVAFAVLLGAIGIVGVTATANISPNIFASSTCNCIPSPLARIQELSVVLLGFGAVLAPLAMRRKTPGSGESVAQAQEVLPSGRTYTGPSMKSGELFALGVSLVVFGIGVVVPATLVLGNLLLAGEGVVMAALGLALAYRGGLSG